MYDQEGTKFYNLENENNEMAKISLETFRKFFENNPPEIFFDINKRFLYGAGDTGALHCISEIFQNGIYKIDYRKISSCTDAMRNKQTYTESKYIQASQFIRQYCLPKPSALVFQNFSD
jgi:hypothetical protein